ncbi:MAG: hypothetical protein KJT03_14280, partial [Verrucomicrobiae bacterium]|nr:hypothetical protein [Verrucomicrobiae bacterium]
SADNTRNYFRTNVAWDGYNVSRIDLLRGPNSILFGLGSPGGVVNATTDSANVSKDSGQIQANFDEYGSFRGTLNYNKVIIQDQLAIRLALLSDNEEFQQRPAYDDEERLFLAGTWRPEGLNRNGITFDISLDYEAGEGTSNRPRTAPPLDWLTPWLEPVSTNPIQLPAGSNYMGFSNGVIPSYTQFVNRQGVTFLDNVSGNRPLGISGWADAFGPRLNVDPAVGTDYWRQRRVWVEGVLNPNGTVYFGNPQASRRLFGYGNAFQDSPLQAFDDYLIAQGHPLGNAFIPLQITDPTVFDFYNLLLDGPNKKEWNDFDQFRAVLSNTFFDQKVGYELSYFSENVTRNQTTYLSNAARIFVDTQLEDIEGNSNPDFGRPYVQETTFDGNRTLESEIEGFRASAYFELDFTESDNDSFWRRMVGRHLFNGAYSEDKTWAFNRNFQRHVLGPEFVEKSPNNPLYNNRTRVSVRYYLGDSIASSIGASGLNIPNMSRYVIPEGGTINLRWFDTTWNAPESVSPSAPWVNPLGQTWEQAANPDNYVGWSQGNYTIVDALSGDPDDLDLATRAASLQDNEVDSKIFTWQGFLVDGILVGTYGWREDESSSAIVTSGSNPVPYNNANLDPAVFNLDSSSASRNSLTVRSNSYSLVAHLNGLPWLGEKLPINVSLSYNEGENFNPTSGRRNVNGQFLGAPQGSTEEYGVLLSTKDNRYTLRVMQYETAVLNGPPTFSIANNFRFNQFLALNPRELVSDIESGEFRDLYNQQTTTPSFSIDDQENIHAPAWRQFERDLAAAFPGFVPTYLSTGTWAPSNTETSFSTGFANTEDNVSKGYEFEFTANPTDSLRITLNASKTKAERTNVPGESTESLYEFIQSKMYNTDGTPSAA